MRLSELWRSSGPGLVVAATGLGAGDIVAAAVAGAEFGTTLVWAVFVGALLKFCLNEGIGRWQLVTGTTLLEGWIRYLPRIISVYFVLYLLFWSVTVGAAMMAATGLAAYALWPVLPVIQWGILHALLAFVIVLTGAWRMLEGLMKSFIALMFVAVLGCGVVVLWDSPTVLAAIARPSVPAGSLTAVLSIMGGVGGSVTLLSYGYWIREAGWQGPQRLRMMRWDLGIAYALTALFTAAIVILAADLRPEVAVGNNMALALAERLGIVTGGWGLWLFLLGFWGATFSSMLGVWHGVPYLFANFVRQYRQRMLGDEGSALDDAVSSTRTWAYRGYLVALCFLPMLLLVNGRPVWIVVLYTVTGALFMPLLAGLLLYLNGSRRWLGALRNGPLMRLCLVLCLALFVWLLVTSLPSG